MRKGLLVLLIAIMCSGLTVNGQVPLQPGGIQINGGTGFTTWGIPFWASADFAIFDNITVGGEFTYSRDRENIIYTVYNYDWVHNIIIVAAHGSYHFTELMGIPSVWDVFAGISLGFSIWNTSIESDVTNYEYTGTHSNGFFAWPYAGGRYFFTDRFAVNARFGAGSTVGLKIGVTFIIKE